MQILPPARRALEVVSSVVIYRAIGRRPSEVYVDDAMNTTRSSTARHRLRDLVYWRILAEPGDQIQDRPGGIILVTAAGECHPISLSVPQPLAVANAFTHAERAIAADRKLADELIANGMLVDALPRRPKLRASHPSTRMLPDSHPLILDDPPVGLLEETTTLPERRPHWTRAAKSMRH
jgi:hypothetical protein